MSLETERTSFEHVVVPNFALLQVLSCTNNSNSHLWVSCSSYSPRLYCHSTMDTVFHVINFLNNIANSLGVSIYMSIGFGMKALSRNVIVLMFKERVVGIVAVHEPGQRIDMNEEMEFLFKHLLYEEGFHQTGPVIGIITTLEEWQLCWLPAHTEYFTTGTSTNSSAASHIDTTGVDTDTGADTGTDTTPL